MTTKSKTLITDALHNYIACPLCDSLAKKPQISDGQKAVCNRCGETLFSQKKNSVDRCLAISLAGLIFLLPAISLPVMGINAVGLYHEASVIDTIELMLNGEFYLVAFCIFMFAIAFPTVRLAAVCYICLRIKLNCISPHLLHFFNTFHYLNSWAMLHVFMLGIVVSMYKLVELADLSVNIGMLAFSLLLLCSTLVSNFFDEHYLWELLESKLSAMGYQFADR
jgi:paraquat-inducible protein A